MTTVGYGDIKATNRPELIMSIINMLIGTSFFTYVTATVTSIISDSDYKMNEYRRFMSSLQYFSGEAKISRSLSNELTKQLSLRWKDEFQKFATWNELRQWVAHDTQYKITLAMYGEEFKHSIFITQIQQQIENPSVYQKFLVELASHFRGHEYEKSEPIAHQNEKILFWCFITEGSVVLEMPGIQDEVPALVR